MTNKQTEQMQDYTQFSDDQMQIAMDLAQRAWFNASRDKETSRKEVSSLWKIYRDLDEEVERRRRMALLENPLPFISEILYSDVHAWEVIGRPSAQTIEIRKLDQQVDLKDCEFIRGGFSAHCPNPSAQAWTFKSDPAGQIKRLRWSKKYECWGGRGWQMTLQPEAFYDVNF